jgi:glycosyltransferase involved in cell wall biosynthesis
MANVSVCIPTYNREKLLKETLDSVFAQNYKDFEVVIVDDGSTDGTKEMLENNGYKVRYFRQKNSGDASARNRLIQEAQGNYITFLDSDDLLFPDSLERLVTEMRGRDDLIVYGPYVAINEFGDLVYRKKKKLYNGKITANLFENILIHSCGSLFPRKVLIESGGFNTNFRVCSDYDLWLRLSLKYDFAALGEPVFKRRRHKGNLSQPSFSNRITEYEVLNKFYYEAGGKKIIPFKAAMKRLSREQYRAAKSAIREQKYQTGCDLLKKSLKMHFNFKTLIWLIIAKLLLLKTKPSEGILILSNNPTRASFRQRISGYLPYLEKAGIHFEFQKLPRNFWGRLRLFRHARHFSEVLIQKKCLNFFDAKILRFYSKRIIYDFDDAIMYSPTKPESDHTSHFRLFRRTAKMADVIIAGNQYLFEHAKRFNSNVHLLETGFDLQPFRQIEKKASDGKIRLVWIGSKTTLKYLLDIKDVLEQVGKENSKIILQVISDEFFEMENMEVEKKKWSLESQVQDLVQCDIGIAPLPDNRFTKGKCGFKVLQYFAAGLPAIASPIGVNLDFIEKSAAGVTASTPEQWKDEILKMAKDAESRARFGQNAKQFVQKFDLPILSERFYKIIKNGIQKT